jgi:hypothetical protein
LGVVSIETLWWMHPEMKQAQVQHYRNISSII